MQPILLAFYTRMMLVSAVGICAFCGGACGGVAWTFAGGFGA
jgi:hypothetical protein